MLLASFRGACRRQGTRRVLVGSGLRFQEDDKGCSCSVSSGSFSSLHTSAFHQTDSSCTNDTALDSVSSYSSLYGAELSTSATLQAASSFEELALFFSPTQLGVQLFEGFHSATGLPWWASIPLATLAVRGALAPLSAKARAASANTVLLHHSFKQAKHLTQDMNPSAARSLGRLALVRKIYHYLRAKHRTPSTGWLYANTALQVTLFITLTQSLTRMSDSLWPGLTSEGLMYFQDLTAPAVYLSPVSTPYGTAGAILPLACVLLYINALDRSAASHSPGIDAALRLMAIPNFAAACLHAHAVLLYWVTHGAVQLGLQAVTRQPAVARMLGAPHELLQPATATGMDTVEKLVSLQGDEAFLQALAKQYRDERNAAGAIALYEHLLQVAPQNTAAAEALAALKPEPESVSQ